MLDFESALAIIEDALGEDDLLKLTPSQRAVLVLIREEIVAAQERRI